MATTTEAQILAGMVLFGATVVNPAGGYCGSYDYTSFAAALTAGTATCPLLLAAEGLEVQEGWTTQTFQGGKPRQGFVVYHYQLCAKVSDVADYSVYRATQTTLRDNYIAALSANPFMTFNSVPTYHDVVTVQPQIIQSEWLDTLYYTNVFKLSSGIYL